VQLRFSNFMAVSIVVVLSNSKSALGKYLLSFFKEG
jgi:hypothetical protein